MRSIKGEGLIAFVESATEFVTVAWHRLAELPPLERIRQAAQLQETANELKKGLSRVTADAVAELVEGGASRSEIAELLGISVQRVGQLLGPATRPDGIDLGQLRIVATVLCDYAPLEATARQQAEEARKLLSRTGRISSREARGTAARLADAAQKINLADLSDVPETLRKQYPAALTHAAEIAKS